MLVAKRAVTLHINRVDRLVILARVNHHHIKRKQTQ